MRVGLRARWLAAAIALAAPSAALLGVPPAGAAPTAHAVDIMSFAFMPASLTIHAGDTVTWTNHDTAPHDITVTSGPAAVHSSTLAKGASWSYTFSAVGSYSYICSFHPDMRATLVVSAVPAVAAATPAPAARHATPTAAPRSSQAGGVIAPPVRTTGSTSGQPSKALAHPKAANSADATTAATPLPAAAGSTEQTRTLKPLLIVAGIAAAIATFCLLVLVSRPDESASG